MTTCHRVLAPVATGCVALLLVGCATPAKDVAAIVTEYRHNSHADIIVSRLLQTDTLDGKGKVSPLKLVALYTDQVPEKDTSRRLAATHGFPIKPTIAETLTKGTGKLAVDGVLLIGEHGDYPRSEIGSKEYPKRRFWDETIAVFKASDRAVPVFMDKHLAITWDDAKHIYDQAREMGIPLMAGSSVPGTWRHPAADVRRGAPLAEIVAITYGATDAYGFHALEVVQALAEQRQGGETGVRAVQCLSGDAVWKARDDGVYDAALFQAAWERLPRHLGRGELEKRVKKPLLFIIEYQRRPARPRPRTQRRRRRVDRRLALPRRRRDRVDPLLDAGGTPRHALHAAAQRHRANDAHRQAHLARRAHPDVHRPPRRPAHLPRQGGRTPPHTPPRIQLPAHLALAAAPAPTPSPPLGRTVANPATGAYGAATLAPPVAQRLRLCGARGSGS